MEQLPVSVETERTRLRRYKVEDVVQLHELVISNLGRLLDWMPWAKNEPQTIEWRKNWINETLKEWNLGKSFGYGIFIDNQLIGGVGAHRRIGKEGIEIGYWLAEAHVGHGFMSEAVTALCAECFKLNDVLYIEIHHDVTNSKSRAIPENLGFVLVDERPRDPQAIKDSGTELIWRLNKPE